jgi:hypothetical protein
MPIWGQVVLAAGVGVFVSKVADCIGWFFKKKEQERRDKADVAKMVFERVNSDDQIEELTQRYVTIYEKLRNVFKDRKEENA